MTRSLFKNPYLPFNLIKKTPRSLKLYAREAVIPPEFVGQQVEIHNGKKWNLVKITESMVGHRFGEFSFSRSLTVHKPKRTGRGS